MSEHSTICIAFDFASRLPHIVFPSMLTISPFVFSLYFETTTKNFFQILLGSISEIFAETYHAKLCR